MDEGGTQARRIKIGSGGFELPTIYTENKKKLIRLIKDGHQELVEFSRWSSADDFAHYVLKAGFLEFADNSYPSPRKKTEVPVWFLLCAQLLMRLYNRTAYSDLGTFLKSGSVLCRVGYNV